MSLTLNGSILTTLIVALMVLNTIREFYYRVDFNLSAMVYEWIYAVQFKPTMSVIYCLFNVTICHKQQIYDDKIFAESDKENYFFPEEFFL